MFWYSKKFVFIIAMHMLSVGISAGTLQDIKFAELPGERAELVLFFDAPPLTPSGYTIDQPARIVLDFDAIENALPEKKYTVSAGEINSAVVVSGGGRTRLIVNLDNLVPYTSRMEGSKVIIEIGSAIAASTQEVLPEESSEESFDTPSYDTSESQSVAISNIDFRRGEIGEGKVIISLTDPSVNIDVEEVSGGIEVRFLETQLPEELRRKLDVLDFATPVSMLSSNQESSDTIVSITATGDYDYLAYQADNQYVISVKPLTVQELEERNKKFAYVGERFSLSFQDIQVRSVLQLIADFTELNLVASDTVSGGITLRLVNVPWDQALDIVLKTKGLDKRLEGNVLMVAPAAEIAERERQEIETKKQLEELAPLRTEYLRIRYANARELFELFIDSGSSGGSGGSSGGGAGGGSERNSTGSLLSSRGQAIVDERTNSIILTDTEEKIAEFKRLIDRVDIPVPQVMIEARIVIANTNFRKELGSRISWASLDFSNGGTNLTEIAGNRNALPDGRVFDQDNGETTFSDVVDLNVFGATTAITGNIIRSDFFLGLELTALQNSGFAEIVSQPKIITGDKQTASIESGKEIPFQEESASGGTTTQFKDAVLKLEVTPQITPDDRIIMELAINQDSVSAVDPASGVPTIDITQLNTTVLVSDGDTVVLGGIYQTDTVDGTSKVPLLGDIPFLGRLFRRDTKSENKKELLIFITPKIMSSDIVE